MKKAFVFLLSVFILGCTPQKQADSTADNSRYQWDNIRKYLIEEPAYALALVDTAQMRGLADTYEQLAFDRAVGWSRWLRLNRQWPNLFCPKDLYFELPMPEEEKIQN